jgi:hypothetical protein
LTVVSLGGGAIGLIAAGALFGISVAQAGGATKDYDEKMTLYLAQLLNEEPSAAWAILAVVGAGLDAGAVVHALEVVVPAAKAFNVSGKLGDLEKAFADVDESVRANVLKAAKQAGIAEQELKAAAGELKEMFKNAMSNSAGNVLSQEPKAS